MNDLKVVIKSSKAEHSRSSVAWNEMEWNGEEEAKAVIRYAYPRIYPPGWVVYVIQLTFQDSKLWKIAEFNTAQHHRDNDRSLPPSHLPYPEGSRF